METMRIKDLIRQTIAVLIVVVTNVLLLTGCNSGPKIVPVAGEVLIDGKPLPTGFIQVLPAGFRAAAGKIENGRFVLTTLDPDDGCVLGTHPVAVIGTQSMGPGAQKWHAPKKYMSTETSELTVNITGPTNNLKVELTWAGGKPFIEKFNKE